MNCVLHYFQMSEAVRPIIWAFSPTFCHLSPILGPRGHVKIESDSQTSMLNRLIGRSCHGLRSELFNTGPIRGLSVEVTGSQYRPAFKENKMLTRGRKHYQTKTLQVLETYNLSSHINCRLYKRLLQWALNDWCKIINKKNKLFCSHFQFQMNEVQWFSFVVVWMKMFVSPVLQMI